MNEQPLGAAFNALADPTRRQLVGMIAERGSVTASEMAREFPITRQAVAKHLAVLQEAGLAEPARSGRETRYALRPRASPAPPPGSPTSAPSGTPGWAVWSGMPPPASRGRNTGV